MKGIRDYREKWKCISRNSSPKFIAEINILYIKHLLCEQMPVRMSSVKEKEGKCLGEVSWKRFRKPKTCSQLKKIKGEKGKNQLFLFCV